MTAMITRAGLAKLTPAEAAALFLVQQDEGQPVEAGLFDEWLAQSEQNQAAWDAVEGAWSLFEDADDPAFAALREAARTDTSRPWKIALGAHWRSIAAAAVLLVVVAGGLQLSGGGIDPGKRPSMTDGTTAQHVYAAAADGPTDFVLADGTHMILDADARARVAIATNQRRVVLDRGGAVFAVRHDASRPFTVEARDRTIVDLGTRFKVALEQDTMRVALYEGSVHIGDATGRVTVLRPGEQLVARTGKPDMIVPIAAEGQALGELVQFDNVTLAAAAETISKGSATVLVIVDPSVAKLRVSGRFRLRDPERFARSASELLPLRVVRVSRLRIELRRRR